jgi:predicted PurR-regulated permease PerM
MAPMRWLLVIMTIALAYFASAVLIPIFLSLFLAMLIEPVVIFLVDRGVSRKLSTYLIVGLLVLTIGASGWFFYFSLVDLLTVLAQSPRLAALADWVQKSAGHFQSSTTNLISHSTAPPHEIVQKVQIVETYPTWVHLIGRAFGSLFELVSVGIFVPLLLFYFLYEKENLVESLNGILGPYLYLPTLNTELPLMIRAFVFSNFVTSVLLVLAHAVALYFLGFLNWMPLALAMGLLNIVPIIGAPAAILTMVGTGVLPEGMEFPYLMGVAVTLVLHIVFNNLVLPLLMGGRTNINTTSLIVGLLFWSWLWGAVGFLIAIPMTALLKIFLESNSSVLPIANLMAARPTAIVTENLFHDIALEKSEVPT